MSAAGIWCMALPSSTPLRTLQSPHRESWAAEEAGGLCAKTPVSLRGAMSWPVLSRGQAEGALGDGDT